MGSNRRSFLQLAGLAPAAAAAGLVGARSAAAATSEAQLTRSMFIPCVGDDFVFEQGAFKQCAAKLARVEALNTPGRTVDGEGQFRLLFEAPAGEGLAQETYRVSHPRLGRFVMFVSPKDAGGRIVEAVFNRL